MAVSAYDNSSFKFCPKHRVYFWVDPEMKDHGSCMDSGVGPFYLTNREVEYCLNRLQAARKLKNELDQVLEGI